MGFRFLHRCSKLRDLHLFFVRLNSQRQSEMPQKVQKRCQIGRGFAGLYSGHRRVGNPAHRCQIPLREIHVTTPPNHGAYNLRDGFRILQISPQSFRMCRFDALFVFGPVIHKIAPFVKSSHRVPSWHAQSPVMESFASFCGTDEAKQKYCCKRRKIKHGCRRVEAPKCLQQDALLCWDPIGFRDRKEAVCTG